MAGQAGVKEIAAWIASGVVVLGAAIAMVVMWRAGGVPLGPTAEARQIVEECGGTISGSTAMTPRLAPEIAAAFLRRSGYQVEAEPLAQDGVRSIVGVRGGFRCTIRIRTNSSTEGFRDLADRTSFVALSQRPITPSDAAMLREAGAGDFYAERARAEHVVGFDGLAVIVNAANPVRGPVSIENIRDIVLKVETNWSVLGGPDSEISLYAPRDGVSPGDYPNDLVPHPNPVWQRAVGQARVLERESDIAAAVARDTGAMSVISAAFATGAPGVRVLEVGAAGPASAPSAVNVRAGIYPFTRRLFVYVRPADIERNAFVQKFVAYFASAEAFDVIERAGFAALRQDSRMGRAAAALSGCRFGTAEYSALVSATSGAVRLPVELRFEPGSLRLDAAALRYVEENAGVLRARLGAGGRIVLIGHSDYTGEMAKNRALALRRALAVRAAFERLGLFGLEVESAGEQCPGADNFTEDGRERNRRVEIWARPPRALSEGERGGHG